MKLYEIWIEGYCTNGDGRVPGHLVTRIVAESFQAACDKHYSDPRLADLYEDHGPSYWGCELFDNETSARKAYG